MMRSLIIIVMILLFGLRTIVQMIIWATMMIAMPAKTTMRMQVLR